MEEIVGLVDEQGRQVGAVPRSVMRQGNLRHGATSVLVRDRAGAILVTQRSADKDWWASALDAASGGVIRAGEQALPSALREIAEELGIVGAELSPLVEMLHEDASVRVLVHAFQTTWTGPITFVDGEVVASWWLTLGELGDWLADPTKVFVPDTRALLALLAREQVDDYGLLTASRPGSGPADTGHD